MVLLGQIKKELDKHLNYSNELKKEIIEELENFFNYIICKKNLQV